MNSQHDARVWSSGEERANCLSHGLGFIGALIGTPVLLWVATQQGQVAMIVGMSVFSATAMLLYLASALHHGLPDGRAKEFFHTVDHAAIFLLIAGTYTPFTLGVLKGPWGTSLLVIIWILAAVGIILRGIKTLSCPRITIALYVVMGWLLITAKPLWTKMPRAGLSLLLAGGVAYTGGLIFYAARRIHYHHLIWHLCAVVGTTCHYFAVLWYAA